MANLRKLERALEREVRESRRQLLTVNARRREAEPLSVVVKRLEALSDGFTLEPVFEYLARLRRLPRAALEARFAEELGRAVPATTVEWLIEALVRKFQREYYLRVTERLPASISRNDRSFERGSPPRPLFEPSPIENAKFNLDPETRLVIGARDPFYRGRRWTQRQIVALAGSVGVSYAELVYKLQRVLDVPRPFAEKLAKRMFTVWVDRRILALKFVRRLA